MSSNPLLVINYDEIENMDVISVELVPERKGLFMKHCEYYVSSRRHGTTVSRRYNDFVQLHDVLTAKYTYRAICRLPPKRVVVGGGSPAFLHRRQLALQRWLSVVARHPVLAHDADVRGFLCDVTLRIERPKHDEFTLAGTQEGEPNEQSLEEMQNALTSEYEQLRVVQLGLARLNKIFERVEDRYSAECVDMGELGAALTALAVTHPDIRDAATIASKAGCDSGGGGEDTCSEEAARWRVAAALDVLGAWRDLRARLTRGLHAERARAARTAGGAARPVPAAPTPADTLRYRLRYSLLCALHEARITNAYAQSAVSVLPLLFGCHSNSRARLASVWDDMRKAMSPHEASQRRK